MQDTPIFSFQLVLKRFLNGKSYRIRAFAKGQSCQEIFRNKIEHLKNESFLLKLKRKRVRTLQQISCWRGTFNE